MLESNIILDDRKEYILHNLSLLLSRYDFLEDKFDMFVTYRDSIQLKYEFENCYTEIEIFHTHINLFCMEEFDIVFHKTYNPLHINPLHISSMFNDFDMFLV